MGNKCSQCVGGGGVGRKREDNGPVNQAAHKRKKSKKASVGIEKSRPTKG